jgi:uncharacterized protein YdcH (DUF465 family)
MSHVPHELAEEFPEHIQAMSQLKQTNTHFAAVAERYHHLNRDIHRAETDVAPTSDAVLEEWKKLRLALKDEILTLLAKAS